ncbi:hypothetical protein ANN_22908 [Periplaneta americana]|uniref:COP9 signalosome complex subunit 2 n=1 Tax=Periplaneta americana TaxID=6978 RepID=A0ABQ8SJL3_PERAM|nr:hypothetical protein ANN_22908 [Periplaneta americana]
MSDVEDDFMCEEEEDYGLEYSEDSNSEPDVDLENQYYNSKALKEDDPKAALASFQKVLDLEGGEKGEWGFKALKQMIKINFKLPVHDQYDSLSPQYTPNNDVQQSNIPTGLLLMEYHYRHVQSELSVPPVFVILWCTLCPLELPIGRSLEGLNPEIEVGTPQHFLFVLSISGSSSFSAWTSLGINYREMMSRYKQLLTYIKSAVTRNHSEKSINSILDYISTSKNMELLQDFYETTLEALKDAKNDRLWFKTNTKLGKLYFDRSDFNKLAKILKQLHQSCQLRWYDEGFGIISHTFVSSNFSAVNSCGGGGSSGVGVLPMPRH